MQGEKGAEIRIVGGCYLQQMQSPHGLWNPQTYIEHMHRKKHPSRKATARIWTSIHIAPQDWTRIDPNFGTAEEMKELVEKTHEKGTIHDSLVC